VNHQDVIDKVIDDALHDGTGMFKVTYVDPNSISANPPTQEELDAIGRGVVGAPGWVNHHQSKPLARAQASILAIDPGPLESGRVIFRDGRVIESGVCKNELLIPVLRAWDDALAIEMIASYGMPVGREVFETCVWIGRFVQAYRYPSLAQLVYRKDVKIHLCGTSKAKDGHIRQALIDLIGPQGVKKAPGPTYGVKSHAWAALAVAVTAANISA
jgi:hypothetical protein